MACLANVEPTAEICDNLDNDCDGTVDENVPGTGESCDTGLSGVCAAGTTECSGGSLECVSVKSSLEVCDNLDNDCDGTVDDNAAGAGESCDTSLPGVCAAGTTECSGGTLTCLASVEPTAEICDNLDNDCDGTVDDGVSGTGESCDTGLPGVCAAGTTECSGGSVACLANVEPTAEICDNLDNDCDGTADDGVSGTGESCDTGLPGVCAAGTTQCSGGSLTCFQSADPSAEICDDQDNDCDGTADEGCDYVSVSTNQFLAGATRYQQHVYVLSATGSIATLASFLPSSVGLDALDVLAGGDLLFSVETLGGVHHAGGYLVLRQENVYRFHPPSGVITLEVGFHAEGPDIGSLDALDRLEDGSFAVSTLTTRGVAHVGGYIVLRPENVYRFDPVARTLTLLFDGRSLGLPDLDGVDLLPGLAGGGPRVAFSTATNRLIHTPTGVVLLEHENVYLYDPANGSVTLVLDGDAVGLLSLDAFSLGVGVEP